MTAQPTGEIVFYQRDDGTPALEVRLDAETVWLSQAQIVRLFQSSKASISEHIANIFAEGELEPEATVRDFRTVREEGSRVVQRSLTHYNLDVIISVGYRVKSKVAAQSRIWAILDAETGCLSQQRIAELFESSRTNIVEHIRHVYDDGEIREEATCRNFRQVRYGGSRKVPRETVLHNLDTIKSVGCRMAECTMIAPMTCSQRCSGRLNRSARHFGTWTRETRSTGGQLTRIPYRFVATAPQSLSECCARQPRLVRLGRLPDGAA